MLIYINQNLYSEITLNCMKGLSQRNFQVLTILQITLLNLLNFNFEKNVFCVFNKLSFKIPFIFK